MGRGWCGWYRSWSGEVAFTEWTSENRLRHPSWRGLRRDKLFWQISLPDLSN
ncbi:ATP dependent DNA ligase [Nocardia goodfellowii]